MPSSMTTTTPGPKAKFKPPLSVIRCAFLLPKEPINISHVAKLCDSTALIIPLSVLEKCSRTSDTVANPPLSSYLHTRYPNLTGRRFHLEPAPASTTCEIHTSPASTTSEFLTRSYSLLGQIVTRDHLSPVFGPTELYLAVADVDTDSEVETADGHDLYAISFPEDSCSTICSAKKWGWLARIYQSDPHLAVFDLPQLGSCSIKYDADPPSSPDPKRSGSSEESRTNSKISESASAHDTIEVEPNITHKTTSMWDQIDGIASFSSEEELRKLRTALSATASFTMALQPLAQTQIAKGDTYMKKLRSALGAAANFTLALQPLAQTQSAKEDTYDTLQAIWVSAGDEFDPTGDDYEIQTREDEELESKSSPDQRVPLNYYAEMSRWRGTPFRHVIIVNGL